MRQACLRWVVVAGAVCAVAAGHVACDRFTRNVAGLKRKKDQTEMGGDSVMGRLGSPATRAEAARQIGREKITEAAPPLVGYLQDKDPNVREACVWALGEIGDANMILDIRPLLTDHEAKVRLAAAGALGKLPGDESIFWLGETMLKDQVHQVRLEAAKALADNQRPKAAEWLTRGLASDTKSIRVTSMRGLVNIGPPAAESGLLAGLVNDDETVRSIATPAVRRIGKTILPKLRTVLTERISAPVRIEIAHLLGEIGGPETSPAMVQLLATMGRGAASSPQAAELRKVVVDGLVAMGPPVLDDLRRVAIEGESSELMEQAAMDVCRRIGKPAVKTIVDSILRFKLHPCTDELKLWLGVLGDLGDPAALPALNRALSQDADGMAAVVAETRRKIEAAGGTKLPDPAPDHDLLIGKPTPEATRRIDRGELAVTPVSPRGGDVPDNGVLRLFLRRCMVDARGKPCSDLEVLLARRDGQWQERLWGAALNYNKREHPGRVLASRRDGDKWVLKIEASINADNWVQGGYVQLELTVAPGPDKLAGSYKGHMNFVDVSGEVEGVSWPRQWAGASVPPLAAEEHPRLLFRRRHLPLLREKAKTEFGRKIIRLLRAKMAAGKRLYAEPLDWIANWEPGINQGIAHAFLATLFDDPAHMERALVLVDARTHQAPYGGEHGERLPGPLFHYPYAADLVYNHASDQQRQSILRTCRSTYLGWTIQRGPVGIWAVGRGLHGIPGNHMLLIVGHKGPFELERPPDPPPVLTLDAPADLRAGRGVPVNAFAQNSGPAQWITAGPLPAGDDDPLAGIGGREAAAPVLGTIVTHKGADAVWEALPATAVTPMPGIADGRQIITLARGGRTSRFCLYCLLDVPEAAGTGLVLSHDLLGADCSRVWVDGKACPENSVLLLGKGQHRVMVEARDKTVCVHFVPVNAGMRKAEALRHQRDVEQYEQARARHEKTGVIQDIPIKLEQACVSVRNNTLADIAAARQGARAGSDSMNVPFASSLWTATGDGLWPDTPMLLAAQKQLISSSEIDARHLIFAMAMAPDDLKGPLVDEFNSRCLDAGKLDKLSCLELVALFVNYPLDVKPTSAAGLADKVQVDRETGVYSFLGDEVKAVFSARTGKPMEASRAMPRAGSFYFQADKRAWVLEMARRDCDNMVLVGGAEADGLGKLLYENLRKDGSGVVGADISGAYGHGVSAERHFAVDYGPTSGAAALLAVVDRVRGGGRKSWVLNCPIGRGVSFAREGRILRVTEVSGGGTRTLTGVVIGPADVKLVWEPEHRGHKPSWRRFYAISEQPNADFFVVMTYSRGEPPKINVTGQGLSAVVTVGGQQVRFDGKKLLLKD